MFVHCFYWKFHFRRRPPVWAYHWGRILWLHLSDNWRLLINYVFHPTKCTMWIKIPLRVLDWGEHEVLRAQPVHNEGHQGWKHGWVRFPLLWGQQVQVLDLQSKVRKVFGVFTICITESRSAGWRLRTREGVHLQRGQFLDRKLAEPKVILNSIKTWVLL